MGEYAKRINDGVEIKIGTCERMYYLRYEDRNRVKRLPNSLDPATCAGLFWRLPFPDEDAILPGEYRPHDRGLRLFRIIENPDHAQICYRSAQADFMPEDMSEAEPGIMQLRHEHSGVMINVPCYHGAKLPEPPPGGQVFWNGRGYALELTSIKNLNDGKVKPVVSCRFCGTMWSFNWPDILPYIPDEELKRRLEKYAN